MQLVMQYYYLRTQLLQNTIARYTQTNTLVKYVARTYKISPTFTVVTYNVTIIKDTLVEANKSSVKYVHVGAVSYCSLQNSSWVGECYMDEYVSI